mgnify:CR=1 FL=1
MLATPWQFYFDSKYKEDKGIGSQHNTFDFYGFMCFEGYLAFGKMQLYF